METSSTVAFSGKRSSTKLDSGAHPPGSRTVFSSNTGSWSKTKCHKAQLKSELAMFGERFIERRTGPRKERGIAVRGRGHKRSIDLDVRRRPMIRKATAIWR